MAPHTTHTDPAHVWQAFRLGDQQAFAQLYESNYRKLYSYGYKLLPNSAQVEDAIQDLFVDLWRMRQNLTQVSSVTYYLFRSLRRRLHRSLEKDKSLTFGADLTRVVQDVDWDQEEDTLMQQIGQLIRQLPDRQQEVITLRFYAGFRNEEIAGIMGITEKSVRNTLHKALTFLRQQARTIDPLLGWLLLICWFS